MSNVSKTKIDPKTLDRTHLPNVLFVDLAWLDTWQGKWAHIPLMVKEKRKFLGSLTLIIWTGLFKSWLTLTLS